MKRIEIIKPCKILIVWSHRALTKYMLRERTTICINYLHSSTELTTYILQSDFAEWMYKSDYMRRVITTTRSLFAAWHK